MVTRRRTVRSVILVESTMEQTSTLELGSFAASNLANVTHSVLGKFTLPSLALAATILFSQTMALQQSPPSLTSSRSSLSLASSKKLEVPSTAKQIHLVILIHGWLGSPSEMGSIQQALESQVEKMTTMDGIGVTDDSDSDNESPEEERTKIPEGSFVLCHSATCNDGKTKDGVTAGGARVAQEVNDIIEEILGASTECETEDGEETTTKPTAPEDVNDASVSISFIGNSLGGLYARSALADIQWDLPNGKKLIPNVFCTTCTPHLGKRGLTYVPIPRFAEQGIGYALQPTGQDLFGLNSVIEELATQAKYVDPLKRFAKRVAYANAFGTDLQVPTSTAAFLADTESPHETEESSPPFLLKVKTPRDDKVLDSIVEATNWQDIASPETHIPATTMARSLDAMGWTKVFCDVRDKLVSVPVPFKRMEGSSEFTVQDKWTSHELKEVIASRNVVDKKWPVPWGHQMMIANSKSEFFAKLNQGGLPFVKQMATEFLEEVLKCT